MSTGISYCDETWSPIVGCSLPLVSKGCEKCWARSLHNQRHKAYLAGKKLPEMYAQPFWKVQLFPERLDQPLHWKKPRVIFAGSQTDLFHDEVRFACLNKMYSVMLNCPQHNFLILTKRPDRMLHWYQSAEYTEWEDGYETDHVYPGFTICNQEEADKKIPLLLQIPAAHRWLSIEPMLEKIDISEFLPRSLERQIERYTGNHQLAVDCDIAAMISDNGRTKFIDQVIVGCESGPGARPCKLEWIRSIVDQCTAAGVACYVKQVHLPKKDPFKKGWILQDDEIDSYMSRFGFRVSTDPAEWPESLRQRSLIWR